MVRGLYIAGTGMLLQRRMMETITHNITNADTTGYKKEHLVSHTFDEEMLRRTNDPHVLGQTRVSVNPWLPGPSGPSGLTWTINNMPRVGALHFGTQVDQLYVDFEQGALEGTERSTDLALMGDAFFVVQTQDGERYTRCGAFYIDEMGYLTDGEGHFLLGENGPVYVGGLNFTVNDLGDVFIDGEYTNRIRVVSFADNGELRKQGSNLYYSLEPPQAGAGPYRIAQGFLEASNIDIGREMVDMLTVYRTYETNQRMVTMIDEVVGKAVNEIGRLR